MGLFDSLMGKGALDRKMDQYEAASAVLISVIASDGDISDEEVDSFILLANRHPLFRSQPGADFNRMIREQFLTLKNHGWKKLSAKGATDLPESLRKTVFALSVDLVFSDGAVAAEEEQVIEHIASILGISSETANTTIQVLSIKNGM